MQLKRILFSAISLLFITTLSAQDVESRQLRDFENVTSYDGLSVQLVPSDKNYVKVSGKNIDKLITQVSGKTLKIKMNFGSNFMGDDNHIIVYFAGELKDIKATEGSSISSNDKIESKSIEIKAIEGATIELNVVSSDIAAKIVSGGQIELEGKSENLSVNINTGGRFDGEKLECSFGEVSVSAGGNAKVRISEVLDASVTMGGNIYYYGKTQTINKSISLGGNIESR
ncbi:MAG: DUF2807 domain-containing protein [Flavobacteriales bacterium]|nr:DUF2807 domain-containing protein [Flavobacteriales bacterium]